MRLRWPILISLLCLILSTTNFSFPCYAEVQLAELDQGDSRLDAVAKIESLTNQIAHKEVQLLRLNTNFRIEVTASSKWKPWRLFFFNLASSSVANAGITEICASRWHYWRHPKDASYPTLISGPLLLLTSHSIALLGVLTEATIDRIHEHKVHSHGLDLKATKHKVLELKDDIDKLIKQREEIIAQSGDLSPAQKQIVEAEGAILSDVRNLGLAEYSQFYVRANKWRTARDLNTILGITSTTTGGFIGSLLGIIAGAQRNPRLVGPGGLGFVISGATIVATPITLKLSTTLAGRIAKKHIASALVDVQQTSLAKFADDRKHLSELTANNQVVPALANRITSYDKEGAMFVTQKQMAEKEKQAANKEFRERLFWAGSVGGTKMAWGIGLANAGFRYHPQSVYKVQSSVGSQVVFVKNSTGTGFVPRVVKKTTFKVVRSNDPRPGQQFFKRVAAASTPYVAGTGMWILDTVQTRVRGEIRDRRLKRMGTADALQLQQRIDAVDELEESFVY